MGLLGSVGKALGSITGKFTGENFGIGGSINPGALFDDGPGNYNIQKRVRDAQKAGIHPLYAMGAQVLQGGQTAAGGGAGFSGEFRSVTQAARERQGLQDELLRAQINQIQAETDETAARAAELRATQKRDTAALAQAAYQPGQITAERLDGSFIRDSSGRLTAFRDANGKWQYVDTNKAPVEILEGEYGESAELQGLRRLLTGMYEYGGVGSAPSMKDLVDFIFNRK